MKLLCKDKNHFQLLGRTMNRTSFSGVAIFLLLAGATTIPPHSFPPRFHGMEQDELSSANDSGNGQRWVFTLQYLASDYEHAVKNGRIIDSLEYGEMQRFARALVTAYQADPSKKKTATKELSQLERLIAEKAESKRVRALCNELMATFIKEMNLVVFPRFAPDLANGERLFGENCVSCHGAVGAGDGPSADTLNPKPRDFTDPQRLETYAPHQFFQAITFGVEGTAMASFGDSFTAEERWDLAFYVMTLRRDFRPNASATNQNFTLQQLATKNDRELAAILAQLSRAARRHPSPDANALIDYCRQNPPQPTMEEYLAIAEKLLKQSLAAYARGDSAAANQLSYDAYWQGFEMIERKLQHPLYYRFEQIYGDYNTCIETPEQIEKAKALMKMMLEILHYVRQGKGLRS
jgi:high-affinity iron transporter